MQEIEAKFLHVDHDTMRTKLTAIGAQLEHPMRLMRRSMFDFPDGRLQKDNWGRVRVRDEGDKITVTYKRGGEGEYSEEYETIVGSYDEMCNILHAVGMKQYSFQESKRETWQYNGVEIVLDVWPFLRQYIEIEGTSEDAIKTCAATLGFDWVDATFGNVDTAYRADYPGMTNEETVGSVSELTFDEQMPEWLSIRKQT